LKRGDFVVAALSLNNFKEKEFDNPAKFDRNRFLNNTVYNRQNNTAFGHGARSCIGRSLAELNIKIIMVKILEYFDLDFLDNDKSHFCSQYDIYPVRSL
jgi:cytochrome P450